MPYPLDSSDPVLQKLTEGSEWVKMFPEVEAIYTCRVCGDQFGSLGEVSVHVRYLHWTVHCEDCGTPFRDEDMLEAHRQSVHSVHPCGVCGKRFQSKKQLSRHTKLSHGKRRHPCKLCGKAFTTRAHLESHMNIHSQAKPHPCEQCGKRFADPSNLRRHLATHKKGKKEFACKLCDKSFSRRRHEAPYHDPHGRETIQVQEMRPRLPTPLPRAAPPKERPWHDKGMT